MVWALSYRPKPDSYPSAEIVEGNSGELELVDPTTDGGTGLAMSRSSSGRRVKPESVPIVIRWKSGRKLLDYETCFRKTVSDRFRAQIEEIEPGVHQFEPVRFIAKDGSPLGTRWFWQVCNRIDSVHRDVPGWKLDRTIWRGPQGPGELPTFDICKFSNAKFWHDKHLGGGTYLSDDAKDCIVEAGITGVHFTYREQACSSGGGLR